MIGGAVAFHAQQITVWVARIDHADIDEEARHADLWSDFIAQGSDIEGDGLLEIAVEAAPGRLGGLDEAVLGQLEEFLERGDPWPAHPVQPDVLGDDGAEHLATLARPGDQDVETTLAAVRADRSEALYEPAIPVLAVADRDEDHIALVALDVLEVFDEDRFSAILALGAGRRGRA